MKKLGIYFLMIMCLFMTGCGEVKTKEVVSLDEFGTVATGKNFTVSDNMSMYPGIDYIVDSKKAVYDDIEIEMVKYTASDYAVQVLEEQIDSFNLLKNTAAYEENYKGDNYHRYVLVSNNRYMVSVQVEDTLIFCKTMVENKETVEAIFDELGY